MEKTREETDASSLSFMLMVESPEEKKPVGFVQVGMLPPPPFFQTESETDAPSSKEENNKDAPYIANLCVLPSYRKSGIGKKMVDICIRWLQKREVCNDVFIAVDAANFGAKRFYEGIDFVWIEPPEMNPSRDYYYRRIQK
jgi:ribosomal protein S18 acetylase RimI-like enzyme